MDFGTVVPRVNRAYRSGVNGLPACQVECGGPAYISARRGSGRAVSRSRAPWQCTRPTGTSSWTKSDTASAGRHVPCDVVWHSNGLRLVLVVVSPEPELQLNILNNLFLLFSFLASVG
jgi:hypothetical protein